jgi:hypothetical protein
MNYLVNPKFIKKIDEYEGYEFWLTIGGNMYRVDGDLLYTSGIDERKTSLWVNKSTNLNSIEQLTSDKLKWFYQKIFRDIDKNSKVYGINIEKEMSIRILKENPTWWDKVTGVDCKEIDISKMSEEKIQRRLRATLKDVIDKEKMEINKLCEKENKIKMQKKDESNCISKLADAASNIKF